MRNVWKGIIAGCLTFVLLEMVFLQWGQPSVSKVASKLLSCPSPAGSLGSAPPAGSPQLPEPLGLRFDFSVKKEVAEICKKFTGGPDQAKEWWHWACLLNKYFATKDFQCKKPVNAGNWVICVDPPWTPPTPCLVYSAGIANQWSFDDHMSKELNCTVHSFDPSMGKGHFMRTPKNLFYNIGLAGKDSDKFTPRRDGYVRGRQSWTMMTVGSIMKYLGHQNLILDVLKIDIELSEWGALEYFLDHPQLMSQRCSVYLRLPSDSRLGTHLSRASVSAEDLYDESSRMSSFEGAELKKSGKKVAAVEEDELKKPSQMTSLKAEDAGTAGAGTEPPPPQSCS